MSIFLWSIAVSCAAIFAARKLLRLRAARLRGRSLIWRVAVRRDGGLAARGWRLRLYGVAPLDQAAGKILRAAIGGGLVRLRLLGVDGAGTLVVALRCDGRNQAVALLRAGLVAMLGTGARRYRQAQAAAQCERRGLWRFADGKTSRPIRPAILPAIVFPWWQG